MNKRTNSCAPLYIALSLCVALLGTSVVPAQSSWSDLLSGNSQSSAGSSESIDGPTYVIVDMKGIVDEKGVASGFTVEPPKSLRSLLFKFRDMREDDDVAGVILRIDNMAAGLGKMQEIRQAISELAAEKPVHAFVSTGSLGGLYLASAATDVTVPGEHYFMFFGFGFDLFYMKRMLGKLGIEAEVLRRGKYKGAMEPFTETEASEGTEESYRAVLDTLFDSVTGAIAADRDIASDKMTKIVGSGFINAEESLEHGLVDFIENEPQFYERLANEAGEEIAIVDEYGSDKDNPFNTQNPFELFVELMGETTKKEVAEDSLALVYLTGMIIDGPPQEAALEDTVISAYPVVDLLEQIRQEENIKSVIIRVDSGGGSAFASDRIDAAIQRLKAEKPVIVSMSDVAASGGYYISMNASEIIANPMTITGSIGVIGAKFMMSEFYDWVGFDFDEIVKARDMNPFDTTREMTDAERAHFDKFIGDVYQKFISKVADGRSTEVDEIHEVAQGRIWSGADAKKQGLIDRTGGLMEAFTRAKELAGLDPDDKYPLEIYPRKLTLAELLERTFGSYGSSQLGSGVSANLLAQKLGPAAAFVPKPLLQYVETAFAILSKERVAFMMPAYHQISW
jgi:protease-4